MKLKIGGSTFCEKDLKSELKDLKSSGFDFAELDLRLPIKPNKKFGKRLREVRKILPILVGHLPINIYFKKKDKELYKKFIKMLSERNVKTFVFHLLSKNLSTKKHLKKKINFIKDIVDFADKYDCIITMENTEEDIKTFKKVFEQVDGLYFCLDIGHANLFSKKNKSIKMINEFKNVLRHIHIHDNMGGGSEDWDLHLPIGAGRIDFKPILDKLKKIKYSGNITLEIFNPYVEYKKISVKRIRKLLR